MSTIAVHKILQEVFILATGRAASAAEVALLEGFAGPKNDWAPLVELVNQYMGGLSQAQGTAAVLKTTAMNGLGLDLSASDAAHLATLIDSRQMNWAEVFISVINRTDSLGTVLNNRAEAAHEFLADLSSAGKAALFSGATIHLAVKNLLANIGASGTSLNNGKSGFDALVANLSASGLKGAVIDGYVSGATVFVDVNGDGVHNPGEFSTVTDANGNYILPATTPGGRIIASGGTDIMTGQPFQGVLAAPAGSTVVNPLTTLVEAMVSTGQAASVEAATSKLQSALGLPDTINLLSFDPLAVLADGAASSQAQAVALAVQASAQQVSNVIAQAGAALNTGGATLLSAGTSVILALADAVAATADDATLNLSSSATLGGITQAAAAYAPDGTALTATQISQLAQITAASNAAAAGATTITALAQAATVAQGAATVAIVNAFADGGGDLSSALSSFTGSVLEAAIDAATPGLIAPGVGVPPVAPSEPPAPPPPPAPVDTTAPTVSTVAITSATGAQANTLNAGDVVSVTVTMSEATTVDTTNGTPQLALTIGGATVQANYASGSGSTALVFTYTIEAGQTDANGISVDANSLTLNGGTLRDGAGNDATLTHAAVADNPSFLVDTTAPAAPTISTVATDNIVNAAEKAAGVAVSGSAEANASVAITWGATTKSVTAAAGGAWTANFASGEIPAGGATMINASATDAAGNTSAAGTRSVSIDSAVPTFVSAATNAAGTRVILTYNEPLSATTAAAGAFAVLVGGAANAVTAVAVVGSTVELTLTTPVAHGAVVTVAYTDPTAGNDTAAVQDAAGNDAATLAPVDVTNNVPDTTAPTFVFAATNTDGSRVILTYNEALSATTAAAGAFAVLVGGAANAVTAVTVVGNTVELTLTTSVAHGQSVTVAYTDPTAGNDTAAVQDAAGNDAATLAATAVTNNVAPSFIVTNTAGVVTFGGTAIGDITFTLDAGNVATFSRGGITATTTADLDLISKITVGADQGLRATAAQVSGRTIDGAGMVLIDALNATPAANLALITATVVWAYVAANVTFTGSLGNAHVLVVDNAVLTTTIDEADGNLIVPSGAGANNGAVVLSGTATGFVSLDNIQTNITFAGNTLTFAEGGSVTVRAASVSGDTLTITGFAGGMMETLQIWGTNGDDAINVGHFTASNALVTVTGHGGVDTITLSGGAPEVVSYFASSNGGATGDVITDFAVLADRLSFWQTGFGSGSVSTSLAGSGTRSQAVDGWVNPKADLASLGANFNGVIRIGDNAAVDFSNAASVAAAAITGSSNGINVILLIDNGVDTRVYFWDDGTGGASNSVVETGELTVLATLVGVTDATQVQSHLV